MHSCFWCHKIILKTLIDIIARTFARIRNNTLRAYVRFHPCSARALPCVHSHQLTQTLSCLMERLVLTAFRLSHQLTEISTDVMAKAQRLNSLSAKPSADRPDISVVYATHRLNSLSAKPSADASKNADTPKNGISLNSLSAKPSADC